jgi:hypothetical protein
MICFACNKSEKKINVFFSDDNIKEIPLRKQTNIPVKVELSEKAPNDIYLKLGPDYVKIVKEEQYFKIYKGESSKTFTLPVSPYYGGDYFVKVKITEAYRAEPLAGKDEYSVKLIMVPLLRALQVKYNNAEYLVNDTASYLNTSQDMSVVQSTFTVNYWFGKTGTHKGYQLKFLLPNSLPNGKSISIFYLNPANSVNAGNGMVQFINLQTNSNISPSTIGYPVGTLKVISNDTNTRTLKFNFDFDFQNSNLLMGESTIDNYGLMNLSL